MLAKRLRTIDLKQQIGAMKKRKQLQNKPKKDIKELIEETVTEKIKNLIENAIEKFTNKMEKKLK